MEEQTIIYKGKNITLSECALYVDQTLEQSEGYCFSGLQEAVLAAKQGTKEQPTVIYLAPDVYWTDDYMKKEDRLPDDLIGLIIEKPYISLVGMTGNPKDVVIASDRGQNAGANGNFNTIGIAHGFSARDLTIGNYCNIDLNYERDNTKNHKKRQESITQAQAVTKAPQVAEMDEWYFENCHIVSRLNLFSRDERPKRSLFKDCHLECTDDSLGTGYISVFMNCDFGLYSNTPCGGASHYMQAYLGCKFTSKLTDNKTITLCKNTKPFAFIDCEFGGDMIGMEWKPSNLSDDLRQIVWNNTLHGEAFVISPGRPELSVIPDAEQMKAFKQGESYNIYNLLNGAGYEEWDPLGQKVEMPTGAWNIQFEYAGKKKDVVPEIEGNESDSLEISAVVFGGEDKTVAWSSSSPELVLETLENGSVLVKGINESITARKVCLTATAANGLQKVLHLIVTPKLYEAPVIHGKVGFSAPFEGKITVEYQLSDQLSGGRMPDEGATSENQPDEWNERDRQTPECSQINWYRASRADGADKVMTAQTTYVTEDAVPLKEYLLRPADVGHYIICEVIPQMINSYAGQAVLSEPSRQITVQDVAEIERSRYVVDFEHLAYITAENDGKENAYEWTNELVSGNWYGGFYLSKEYRPGEPWEDKAFEYKPEEAAFTFAKGVLGAAGTVGMQTTTQGARLVYVDDTECRDMSLTVTLSPHKTGAQGFGSAKQFLDIYFKYDARTQSGYGLRIVRLSEIANPILADYAAKACSFVLMEYKNGIATELEPAVVSTAFLGKCMVKLCMRGDVLTADVSTTGAQGSEYPAEMPHEVHIEHRISNLYSGFGFQHTGTAGAGKSGNRITIHSCEVLYE